MRVAIIGAGITGLSAAYDLQKKEAVRVTLYEQNSVPGGKVQTIREGPYLIEQGPDSIFSTKPWATELMVELGMEGELAEPCASEFSILTKGKLHKVPRGLASLMPSASQVEEAGFLSPADKRLVLQEGSVQAGDGQEESVASFFRRRFGKAFSMTVAEPMLAGTHAGDPEKLSMPALYPAYVEVERNHGSFAKTGAARAAVSSGGARRVGFVTLRGGMGSFTARLAAALTEVEWKKGTHVTSVELQGSSVGVRSASGVEIYDEVLLALPAYQSAELLRETVPAIADLLRGIRFVSTAIVTLAYPRMALPHPVTGTGFLVSATENFPLSGCTWTSDKWADRAPDDTLLLRAFLGRDGGLQVDDRSDEELIATAVNALNSLLSPKRAPTFSRVDRWSKGMAQYELGHLNRLSQIDAGLEPLPLFVAGSSYRGNSIPDCVRQGRDAAGKILSSTPSRPA